uniref:type II toxin-antitoxin system death-on-curing family toxin n=1 Tax=uncultured Allobacillus sp. TaxID=1638025 RepID=UPI00259332C8|nr:type II toxin-antitoxin system death-on-curing family toxin [uncultured Allobacillus sp.]
MKEVVFLNFYLIKTYSPKEQAGVKDANLLESALARPMQTLYGKDAYPTIYLKAAALFESLCQNHPFHNANKRTGFASMKQFLWINGMNFTAPQDEAEEFTMKVVIEKPELQIIADWIKKYSVYR